MRPPKEDPLAMVALQIGFMKVGAMQSDAGVFFGQNIQNGWDSHGKSNHAGQSASGDLNWMMAWNNVLFDPDAVDSPIVDPDIKSPTWAHVMGV
ncbi:hypothetical protein [Alicyclobacillus sp.]|uniref:hypothetical protein n=1 Tax=Alicyclobacillus sp. TaxID=61169 RepID=UPI0025C0A14E|nr:hypothetical protein [Alicyclobacillus sp.]MCL6515802.1 hypothetical protein [Alicyclobacillus sp.]